MTMQTLESKDSITVCPCHNCICLAICRHKRYSDLFGECCIIYNWYRNIPIDECPIYRYVVKYTINPTRWNVNPDGTFAQLETRDP